MLVVGGGGQVPRGEGTGNGRLREQYIAEAPAPTVVYGIPLPPTATSTEIRLVKTVMSLAALLAVATVTVELINVLTSTGTRSVSLFSLFASLTVPACGYFGARGRNRVLLQTYSFVNWCCAFQFFLLCAFELINVNRQYEECEHCKSLSVEIETNATTPLCKSTSGETLDMSDCDSYMGKYLNAGLLVVGMCLLLFYTYNGYLSMKLAQLTIFTTSRVGVNNNNHGIQMTHPHALQTATNVGAGYNGQRVTPVMGHVIVVNERQAGGGGGSGSAPK
jgi:hypothetical protein